MVVGKLHNQVCSVELIEGFHPNNDETLRFERIRAQCFLDNYEKEVSVFIDRDDEIDPVPELIDEEWLVNALKVMRKLKKKVNKW